MNVIFLDFDGVLTTIHRKSNEDAERRIKILADICKELDCKIVIEASCKDSFNFEIGEINGEWPNFVYSCFEKYGIECIGRTPNVRKRLSRVSYKDMWKEYEIAKYLSEHPEIEHFCVLDDNDDFDLEMFKEYLVSPIYYCKENPDEEGLLEKHKEEIKQKLLLPRKKRTH